MKLPPMTHEERQQAYAEFRRAWAEEFRRLFDMPPPKQLGRGFGAAGKKGVA